MKDLDGKEKSIDEVKQQNLNILLGALFVGFLVVYIDKLSVSIAILNITKDIPMSDGTIGLIMSAFFIGYAICQLPMSLMINKFGSRIILLFSIVMIGVFDYIFSMSTTITMLIVTRLLTGMIAHSGCATASSKEIADNFPIKKITFAKGVLFSTAGFAAVIGPLVLSPIITGKGWRASYHVLTIFALLVAIILYFLLPKKKKVRKAETIKKVKIEKKKVSLMTVWKIRNIWSLFFVAFFINSLLYGATNWVPKFLSDHHKYSLSKASVVISSAGVLSLLGALLGSFIIGKFFQNKDKRVISILSIVGAFLVSVSYFIANTALFTIVIGSGLFLLTAALVTLMALPMKVFVGNFFSPGYATIALGGIIGGAVTQIIIGKILDITQSYAVVFTYFAILGLLSGIQVLFFNQDKYPKEEILD